MNPTIDRACRVHVIAVSSVESDHIVLAHIFGHTSWKLDSVRSIHEAEMQLSGTGTDAVSPVLLCDRELSDGTWKDLLRLTRDFAEPQNLIVTAADADDRLWAEILNLGAYDVLEKPFRPQEVYRTVGLAWSDRRKAPARKVNSAATAKAIAVA